MTHDSVPVDVSRRGMLKTTGAMLGDGAETRWSINEETGKVEVEFGVEEE